MDPVRLQIEITHIVLHKARQLYIVFHLSQTDIVSRNDTTEVDFLAVQANPSALSDRDRLVVERVCYIR